MKRYVLLFSLLFAPFVSSAGGIKDGLDTFAEKINLSGYLKNETAYRYLEPRAFTKIRNTLFLQGNYPFSESMELSFSGRAYYDLAYDLLDYDTISARSERDFLQPLNFIEGLPDGKDSNVAEIRELYLDIFFDNVDIRIGKQFVIWGVMTGVRIVDEINPMDFRELILPDLLDYRIPLWTLKANYYGESNEFELLWIPDIQAHRPAASGSEWELLQEVPGTVYPENFTLENSEYGLKWSRTIFDAEVSLSYFYTWDDFPVIFRRVPVDVVVVNGEIESPVFYPEYTQIHMFGSTLQRAFGGQIIKGEFAYVQDKYFGLGIVDDDNDGYIDNLGEIKKDHIRWGVGVDFNLWKTDFSPGFTQWVILDYDDNIIQEEFDSSISLFVRKELPEQGAVFQMLFLYLVSLNETYTKPKITFNVTNQFQIAAGMDIFSGPNSQIGVAAQDGRAVDLLELEQRFQFIGNFSKNDRIFLELKYNF